jgi:uncharacterized protein
MDSVAQLWRYPVKSMLGEQVPAVELSMLGVVGDRQWATRDEVRGGIRGAKQIGGLMRLAARLLDDGTAEITFPDGTSLSTAAPDVSERLSDELGHPVTLEPLRPASDLDHYRRGPSEHEDAMVGLREVFALEADEPLPNFGRFPPEVVEFESPPGTYYDCWPLLVMTDASLRSFQALAPDSVIDVRRFRPSMVVTTGAGGFPEAAWEGRRFSVGTAEIEVLGGCPRCVMTTRGFADLPEDRSIMRTLVRERGQELGAYARVLVPGTVRVGDALVPV